MEELRPVHRAYIAGFFDGEGCVHFLKNRKGFPRVSMTQKDPKVLAAIQEMLGMGGISPQGECWQLSMYSGADTLAFIRVILRYSIVKRKALLEAKRFLEKKGY